MNSRVVQRGIYIVVLAVIVIFLFRLGSSPWVHVWQHWQTFLAVMVVSAIGIIVQAYSFGAVASQDALMPKSLLLIRIWSLSGALSVIVPIFAGLGTRTALLLRSGVTLPVSLFASARQAWMGLEYALVLGAAAVVFTDYSGKIWVALGLFCVWLGLVLVRLYSHRSHHGVGALSNRTRRVLSALSAPILINAHFWFPVQVLLMGLIYYMAFHGFGADIGWAGAILLAAITVLASLVVFVPNGMGVLDALWVGVGMSANLHLAQSVAFALTLRLSYLAAAILVWLAVSLIMYLLRLNRRE